MNYVYLDLVQQWMRARPIDMMLWLQSSGIGWHVWMLCVGWCVGKRVGVCVWGEGRFYSPGVVRWRSGLGSFGSRRPRSFCAQSLIMQHFRSSANLDSLVLDLRWRPPSVTHPRPKGSQGLPAIHPQVLEVRSSTRNPAFHSLGLRCWRNLGAVCMRGPANSITCSKTNHCRSRFKFQGIVIPTKIRNLISIYVQTPSIETAGRERPMGEPT